MYLIRTVLFFAQALCVAHMAYAQEIVLGRTLPVTGPIAVYGKAKMEGGNLAIQQVNDQGGINGRSISVVTLDDAYDPVRAERNVRELDERHRPVALMGAVGVPVVASILPTMETLKLPVVGLSSGADAVRTPSKRYVFPVRASYRLEGEHTVRLLKTIGTTRIAILRQSDPFGTTVAGAYEEAARAAGLEIAGIVTIDRDQEVLDPAITEIRKIGSQAVLLALNAEPASRFVKAYRGQGGAAGLYAMSVTDMSQVSRRAGDASRGMAFSQVVPVPTDATRKVVREYAELATKSGHVPSFYGLEGFIEARVLIDALRRCGGNINREGLVEALERVGRWEIGGYTVEYGKGVRTGSVFVEMAIIGTGGKLLK